VLDLILASTSRPRKILLERLQIPFECVAPNVDETPLHDENPEILVKRLAKEKAEIVAHKFPRALIIGADQVGVLNGIILCKPMTDEKAIEQLQMVSGKTVTFFTGLCVLNSETKAMQIEIEIFNVSFRTLSLSMIKNYLQKEKALNCAGSLKIEGLGITLVEKLSGEDYTALIGLPLIKLTKTLELMDMPLV
jgi:septum formation protein